MTSRQYHFEVKIDGTHSTNYFEHLDKALEFISKVMPCKATIEQVFED